MTSQSAIDAAEPSTPMIVMEGVEKWYGSFKALSDINLSVRTGEKIVLCGPSGSGKSTLIRCINHLESYSRGRILVDGILVDETPCRPTRSAVRSAWCFSSSICFRT